MTNDTRPTPLEFAAELGQRTLAYRNMTIGLGSDDRDTIFVGAPYAIMSSGRLFDLRRGKVLGKPYRPHIYMAHEVHINYRDLEYPVLESVVVLSGDAANQDGVWCFCLDKPVVETVLQLDSLFENWYPGLPKVELVVACNECDQNGNYGVFPEHRPIAYVQGGLMKTKKTEIKEKIVLRVSTDGRFVGLEQLVASRASN
ncbi:hypothetical protein KY320_03785 [Candidatus Woesearchaeota archaeon]|nr:hypothetical protein [Candidatus Woesearchaeota archaeon]